MAEENLGTAVLKIVVDDDQARATLDKLKSDIRQVETGVSRATSTRTSSRATSGPSSPAGLQFESISRQDVSRFNLRGFTATLQSIADDLNNVATARNLNINSSWTAALSTLTEVQEDLQQLAAGKKLNINTSWTAALATLSEVQEGLQTISAGKKLNIDASWASALTTLGDIQQDIQTIASAKKLNIDASWSAALTTLSEVQQDLQGIAAAKKLNIDANWTAALTTLAEVQQDLQGIAAAKKLNLDANWTAALTTLSEVQQDLQGIAAAKKLNLDSSWNAALQELQQVQLDLQAIAATKRINIKSSWAKALDFLDETAQIISDTGRQRDIQEGLRIGRQNAVPIRGGAAFPGSPAFLDSIFPSFPKEYFAKQAREVKAASQKQQGIITNAIIGGAFPLLFGQGIGASIGGAAGGAAGGAIGGQFGFGLSLVGTALGTQFDVAIQKSGELAKALDNPIAQFGALQQNALLSSKGLEKQIQSLIASGREAEAAALIQEDLNKLFGDAEGAKEYQNAVDRLNRSYSQATVILTNFVAGPLADFLERIVGPTRNTQLSARIISEKATLDPQQRKQFAAFAAEERRRQNLGPLPSSLQVTELYVALLGEINRLQGKNNTALATAAGNQKILTQSAQTLVGLEAAINRARISGNKPLEESITLQQELLKNYRERKLIEQQLAAGTIKALEATERTRQSFAKDVTLQQNYVNSTRQSAANAVKELQTTKQLSGLEGVRLEVARKRLEIDEAANAAFLQRTEFINAREKVSAQPTNLNKALAQGAFQELATAGVQFETKLRQAADYLVKAAKDAAQNLTTAILNLGKLEADPAGLNRFLTPNEQFESTRKAILRLGTGADGSSQLENAITKATELLGLTRGQANERFQGLRDIFAQARQGVFASQEGFNTLSSFIEDTRAREQAVTGLDDAQKTLTDVTALSASVQQELVGAVKENSVLLNSLFGKDWNVNVSVSGAEANVSGDAVNRQLSP